MNKKKAALAALALTLVGGIGTTGTLAYLTARQSEKDGNGVVNTFSMAGLIEPDSTLKAPIDGVQDGFYLVEHTCGYDPGTSTYYLNEENYALDNIYDQVVPGMELPKDPQLFLDLAAKADAWVFVKIIDTTQGNLTYGLETWVKPVEGLEGIYTIGPDSHIGDKKGKPTVEFTGRSVLKNDMVTVSQNPVDVDETTPGMQLGELKFEAYVCQAGGFENAKEAFEACFPDAVPAPAPTEP